MTLFERQIRRALLFGAGVSILQLARTMLWGHWPPLSELPIDADGYLAGAAQVGAAVRCRRVGQAGRPVLAATWGIWVGILYRSFTEQIADPGRHAGHEVLVIGAKGLLLALAILGLADAAFRAASD
jgi:hypothetical protein